MTAPPRRSAGSELGRYLEIQNLGLNLPFAIAFLFAAAHGLPSAWPVLLIVIAFVAARNAGHSFNRWADLEYDRANPRTQDRALVTGRYSPRFALGFAALNGLLLVAAAFLLGPLAFALSFVALAIIFGYSYTKRYTALTTPFLGFVEAITPGAVFIAVQGTLEPLVLWAVFGMLLWGTAFETIHSLGDLEADRALRLRSLPLRIGVPASLDLLPVLHGTALALLAVFGWALGLAPGYDLALVAMGAVALATDLELRTAPSATRGAFRRHFLLSAVYLAGLLAGLFL